MEIAAEKQQNNVPKWLSRYYAASAVLGKRKRGETTPTADYIEYRRNKVLNTLGNSGVNDKMP